MPRLTSTQRNAIVTPPNGLLIYNTVENCFNYYNAGTNAWKSMCNVNGISYNGDTVIINLLKSDSSKIIIGTKILVTDKIIFDGPVPPHEVYIKPNHQRR